MSRKTRVILGFALAIGLNFFGCKGKTEDRGKIEDRPTEEDGKAAILQAIKVLPDSENGGRVKLLRFRKTDGQDLEFGGVKMYKMEYEYEIEFTRDCYCPGHGFISYAPGIQYDRPKNVESGQRMKINGIITFEKTEKGWRIEGSSTAAQS
jgi:hypothetical protein